jgi:hypothetical protein
VRIALNLKGLVPDEVVDVNLMKGARARGGVPRSQPDGGAADKIGWKSTGRIDFSDPNAIGKLMLEVEETRSAIGSLGVEHREIRWRSATVDEAKMVLESYNALRNLAMTATFTVSAPAGTKRKVNGQADSVETELKDVAYGQDVTLVPQDVTR